MTEVYILSGSSGSYGSASEWTVAVYEDKAEAETAAKRLNDAIASLLQLKTGRFEWVDLRDFFVEHGLSLDTIPYSGDPEDIDFCAYAAPFVRRAVVSHLLPLPGQVWSDEDIRWSKDEAHVGRIQITAVEDGRVLYTRLGTTCPTAGVVTLANFTSWFSWCGPDASLGDEDPIEGPYP